MCCIAIRYKEGLNGQNILILKERDVMVITDLMMGGDGTNTSGELNELHLSAISDESDDGKLIYITFFYDK